MRLGRLLSREQAWKVADKQYGRLTGGEIDQQRSTYAWETIARKGSRLKDRKARMWTGKHVRQHGKQGDGHDKR